MQLQKICKHLKGDDPPLEVELVSCKDADEHMDAFLDLLRDCKIRKLLVRTDFLMRISEENVSTFLNTLGDIPTLEDLVIQSSSRFHIEAIPASGLEFIERAVQLKVLTLEDMQVTASHKDFILGLATSIQNHSSLEQVVMTNFFANDWSNTEANVLDPLLLSLSTLSRLNSLELSGCGSHSLSGQDIYLVSAEAISMLLFNLPRLTTLQLSFLELEGGHFEAIALHLRESKCLELLSMDYHNLDSQGFRCMMQAMESNSSVKTLSLRSLRDIGDEGFSEAMCMLQSNYTIEKLSVTASPPSHQARIDLYLRMNGAGRGLLREPAATIGVWIDVIAQNSDDLDVVRHILQEIPELCNVATLVAERGDPLSVDLPATTATA